MALAARKRGVDPVVCGHIHRAEMREIDGVLYCNDGDWVESCTSLVEDMNGQLRLIDWPKLREQIDVPPMALPAGQAAWHRSLCHERPFGILEPALARSAAQLGQRVRCRVFRQRGTRLNALQRQCRGTVSGRQLAGTSTQRRTASARWPVAVTILFDPSSILRPPPEAFSLRLLTQTNCRITV